MGNQVIKRTVIYEGLFVYEWNDVCEGMVRQETPFECATLENPINNPHITVVYRPAIDHNDFYGADVYAVVRGYGNDGINEGYLVELIPGDGKKARNIEFCKLLCDIKTPHITLSVSNDGKPVDTNKLTFETLPMNEQFVLECRFGAFVVTEYEDGTKETGYHMYRFL